MNKDLYETFTDGNDLVMETTHKIYTQIVNEEEKERLQAINTYCKEKGIIPNLIDENMLKEILKLGIEEYNKREQEKSQDKRIEIIQ